MDKFTRKQRSLLMAKVRTKNTDIERLLGGIVKSFWKIERYRKNVQNLPGKPDLLFPKSGIIIFADGDFWHGRNFSQWKNEIPVFWKKKVGSNIVRDLRQNKELRKRGYRVLRFWGSFIKGHPDRVKLKISRYLAQKVVHRQDH